MSEKFFRQFSLFVIIYFFTLHKNFLQQFPLLLLSNFFTFQNAEKFSSTKTRQKPTFLHISSVVDKTKKRGKMMAGKEAR